MPKADALLERIEAFPHTAKGEVVVRKVARGYSLFSPRTGAPIARLQPTGEADKVLGCCGGPANAGAPQARSASSPCRSTRRSTTSPPSRRSGSSPDGKVTSLNGQSPAKA